MRGFLVRTFVGSVAHAAAVAGLAVHPAGARTHDGILDGIFGTNGGVEVPVKADSIGSAVAVQHDGKSVVAGSTYASPHWEFAVARFDKSGDPDPTFHGTDNDDAGTATLAVSTSDSFAHAIAIQPDGKIVVAGQAYIAGNYDFAVVRFNTNGTPDTNFGNQGVVTIPIGAGRDEAHAVALQPDGKILVAGFSFIGAFDTFEVVRLTSTGALDGNFNGTGIAAMPPFGTGNNDASAIGLLSNGEIAVGGTGGSGFAVVLLHSNGTPDTNFDGDGVATLDMSGNHGPNGANALAVDKQDRIVLAGYERESAAVARYNLLGALDPSFAGDGKIALSLDYPDSFTSTSATGVAIQPDGRIVVSGTGVGSPHRSIAWRLNDNGEVDTSFGERGLAVFDQTDERWDANGAALQSDGGILVAGTSFPSVHGDFALTRFRGDQTAPWGASVVGLPQYSLGSHTIGWVASDIGTGVKSFDVRHRTARWNSSSFGGWTQLHTADGLPFGTLAFGTPGTTDCVEVAGRDFAGNVGAYGAASCTSYPLDERSMTGHGPWAKVSSASYYRGTAMSSTINGASLTTVASYKHLAVVVTTCHGCGTIKVYRDGTYLGAFSLNSSSTVHHKTIQVAASATVQHGLITVKQASPGHSVVVEGLAVELG